MHVLIVGAGIGGLSLAQNLRKQGISFEIFERDSGAESRFQGWAIAMHSYGLRPHCPSESRLLVWTDSVDSSIVKELVDSFPGDMPDLRESTNHLAPLTLPAQLAMYIPGREHRFGFQVRRY